MQFFFTNGFYKGMVEEKLRVENPANAPMHYYNQRPLVGVLTPPDYIPMRRLYSYLDGLILFSKLDHDTYELQKNVKNTKGRFPAILKLIGGLALGGLLISSGVKGIKKLARMIFRR